MTKEGGNQEQTFLLRSQMFYLTKKQVRLFCYCCGTSRVQLGITYFRKIIPSSTLVKAVFTKVEEKVS